MTGTDCGTGPANISRVKLGIRKFTRRTFARPDLAREIFSTSGQSGPGSLKVYSFEVEKCGEKKYPAIVKLVTQTISSCTPVPLFPYPALYSVGITIGGWGRIAQ